MSAEYELLGLLASLSPETRERACASALTRVRVMLRDDARWPDSRPPVVPDVSDRANALQDRIHATSGRLLSSSPVVRECYVLSDEEGGHG